MDDAARAGASAFERLVILGLRSPYHAARAGVHQERLHAALGSTEWPDARSWVFPALIGDALGNDRWGNCVEAGMLRQLQLWRWHASGDGWVPAADGAVSLNGAISGFDPSSEEPPGPGTALAAAEEYWARTGLSSGAERFRTAVPVSLPVQDLDAIDRATAALGGVGMCWDMPEYCEEGAEWDWPASPSDIAGRHYTLCVGYNRLLGGRAGRYSILSWGRVISVSEAFVRAYLVSAVGWIGPDWFGAAGNAPSGVSRHQGEGIAAILSAA